MKQSIYPQLQDSAWLTDQVVNQHKNCAQIARELGIANRSAVNRAVKKLGLSDKVTRTKYPELSNKEWLIEQLRTKTLVQIADEIGTTSGNVADRVRRYGLSVSNSKSEAVKASLKKRFPEGRYKEKSSNWKGGRRLVNGYIKVYAPDHPDSTQGAIFEHRLVASQKLGRRLTKDEVVHHINGNKQDNRPDNLEVHTRGEHFHQHYTDGENIKNIIDENARLKKLLDDHGIDYNILIKKGCNEYRSGAAAQAIPNKRHLNIWVAGPCPSAQCEESSDHQVPSG